MRVDPREMKWTRPPRQFTVTADGVEMVTEPHTDLWQRTYYRFRNDNAPVLQLETEERYFSFTVRTEFDSKARFDQSGVAMYLDSENWLKASVEYEDGRISRLGSVVTNNGWSDWATVDVDASLREIWFRLSRREDDFCLENSPDGVHFKQMRICHMFRGGGKVSFGVYACSPEDSAFRAVFDHMEVTECRWLPHNGQAPDE